MKYLKNSFKLFLNSFKLDMTFLYSALTDLLFYIFVLISGVLTYNTVIKRVIELAGLDATGMGIEQIGIIARQFMLKFYILIFIAVVLFIFYYSIFKSIVWSLTLKTKLTKKYTKNFSILSLFWILGWLGIIFILAKTIVIENTLIILLGLIILNYFTKLLFISFTNNKANIKKGFEQMIDISFKKFYLFILPYFLEFIVFFVLFVIIFNLRFIPMVGYISLIYLTVIVYFAWARKYFSSVVKQIK